MLSKVSFFLLISFSIAFADQNEKQSKFDPPSTLAPVKTRCGGRSPFQSSGFGNLFPGLGSASSNGVDQTTLANLLAQQQQLIQSVLQLLQRFQGGAQQGFPQPGGFQQTPFPNNNVLPNNPAFQQTPFPNNNALPNNPGFQTNPNIPSGTNPNQAATGQNPPSAFGTGQTGNPTGTNPGFNPNNVFPTSPNNG